jgi:hypothetical protein
MALPSEIHILIVVYGEKYCQTMSEITLPNVCGLISTVPENIKKIFKVRIVTTPEDKDRVLECTSIKAIREHIPVEIADSLTLSGYEQFGGYGPMVVAQAKAVYEASLINAAIIFVGPDIFFSKSSFETIVRQMEEGRRIIVGPSLRAISEKAKPTLLNHIKSSTNQTLLMDGSDVVKFVMDHWHPENDLFWWNKADSAVWKAYLYYKVSSSSLLMKFIQGPTFFAWPLRPTENFEGWIDHSLVLHCASKSDDVYIVQDSDELICCDLTSQESLPEPPLTRFRELDLIGQCFHKNHINRMNLRYALKFCLVHANDDSPDLNKHKRKFQREVNPIIYLAIAIRPFRRAILLAGRKFGYSRIVRKLTKLILLPIGYIAGIFNK